MNNWKCIDTKRASISFFAKQPKKFTYSEYDGHSENITHSTDFQFIALNIQNSYAKSITNCGTKFCDL